jgi:uncharacterized membrane protein YGL010W
MPTIHQWLSAYGESLLNETNKIIHWICVLVIFFSIIGLLFGIKLPYAILDIQLNAAIILMLLLVVYYFTLSRTIWIGMLMFGIACLLLCHLIEKSGIVPLWLLSILLFVIAWIGQFYGHKVEGKKPSFLKDIRFLMIGPAWLMSFIYKKVGIKL